jgi:hypothetical protein
MRSRRARGEGTIYFDRSKRRWFGSFDDGKTIDGKRVRRKVTGKPCINDAADGTITSLSGESFGQAAARHPVRLKEGDSRVWETNGERKWRVFF